MPDLSSKPSEATVEQKKSTVTEANLQTQATEHVLVKSATAQPIMASADFNQKDKLNTAVQNQDVQGTYEVTKSILENMDHDKFNEIRANAGLKPIEVSDIHNPNLREGAISETAAKVSKNLVYFQGMTLGFLKQINQLEKVNNVEGAGKLKTDMESILKTTTTKEQAEVELQKIKTKYVESGETDLASAVGEVQETSKKTWGKVNEWSPEKTVAKIVPSLFVSKVVSQYIKQLRSNVNAFLKEYNKKVSSLKLDDGSKNELMKEAEAAKKVDEKISEEKKNNGEFEKIFEKHLKDQMNTVKKNITDAETLSQINKIENGGKIDVDSESLLIENMHPTVATGVLKAYRAAVDEALATA